MSTGTKKLLSLCITVIAMVGLSSLSLAAEDYPSKTIHLVAHSKPGGGMDNILRNLGKAMGSRVSVPVVTENKPGGGAAIATTYVATNKAAGYYLLGTTNTHTITPITTKTPHSLADLKPVCRLLVDPLVLVARSDKPWNNLKELLEDAKANPGKISWGAAQVGSLEYLILHKLVQQGYQIKAIPFEGGGQLITSVAGGHVDVAIAEPGEVNSQVKAGNLKVIGTFTEERLPNYPEVPTAVEQEYDIQVEKFRAIMTSKETSPEVIDFLVTMLKDILENDEGFKNYYTSNDMVPAFQGPEKFGAYLDKLNEQNRTYLKEIGLVK